LVARSADAALPEGCENLMTTRFLVDMVSRSGCVRQPSATPKKQTAAHWMYDRRWCRPTTNMPKNSSRTMKS